MNPYLYPGTRFKIIYIVVVLLALGALGFAGSLRSQAKSGPPPLDAQSGERGEAEVSAGSLNLRTGPDRSYTAVAYLMEGEEVHLVGRNRNGSWVQIQLYNGYRGWVNASYIRPTIDIEALPIVDVSLLGITAFVTNDPVPVYAGAGAHYELIGRGEPGEVLALNGRNDAATWVHVYLPDGRPGWARADSSFLPSASINDLPILTPFTDAPPPDLAPFFLAYSGPGFLYEPLENVREGQSLSILGRTADSRWLNVELPGGRSGWIAAEIIHLSESLERVPVIQGIAPPQVVGWQQAGQPAATNEPTAAAPTATSEPAATEEPSPTAEATATEESATPEATASPAGGKQPAATATAEPEASATPEPTSAATATATTAPTEESATAAPTEEAAAPGDATPEGLPIVYVYATPDDTTSPILRVVPGQSVVLIGRTADMEWIKIWLPGGQEGWLRAGTLQLELDVAVLPVVEP